MIMCLLGMMMMMAANARGSMRGHWRGHFFFFSRVSNGGNNVCQQQGSFLFLFRLTLGFHHHGFPLSLTHSLHFVSDQEWITISHLPQYILCMSFLIRNGLDQLDYDSV
ncbi:hypothetical protein B0T21DRAFT_84922 [Apiosordaria backusii]|uniref:Secreted protein n=1 Tax=Apiosordaria backusii TaxID=314023 RepID=A0AA40DKL5_9PEZI|nr:hypothetical protein B0T21DRAFT_84922 [Apiosordaria backusii]